MSTAVASVHVEVPHANGHALYEGAVNWSACSAVAVECAVAGRESRIPDVGNAKRLWSAMLAAGQTTGSGHGATLSQCVWALEQRGYHQLETLNYPANLDALHALLKAAGVAGDPVVLLVTNGQALPDNERGVQGHFVVAAGIDSAHGYLIQNGDTQTAIRGQAIYGKWPACSNVPTNWANWATLVAAQVCGAIRVKSNQVDATPTTPVGAVAPPQVQEALAAVEQASVALQTAEAALKSL